MAGSLTPTSSSSSTLPEYAPLEPKDEATAVALRSIPRAPRTPEHPFHKRVRVAKRLFPIRSEALAFLRTRRPSFETALDPCSPILTSESGAGILLGADWYYLATPKDDAEFSKLPIEVVRALNAKHFTLSDIDNPHKIKTILAVGSRHPMEWHLPSGFADIEITDLRVDDSFSCMKDAADNLNKFITNATSLPKAAELELDFYEEEGRDPFTGTVYKVETGSLKMNLSVYDLFNKVFEKIHVTHSEGRGVFIHCARGISRSTTLVILYLMYHFNMRYDTAKRFVQEKRPFINPNPLWESFSREIERLLDEAGHYREELKAPPLPARVAPTSP